MYLPITTWPSWHCVLAVMSSCGRVEEPHLEEEKRGGQCESSHYPPSMYQPLLTSSSQHCVLAVFKSCGRVEEPRLEEEKRGR